MQIRADKFYPPQVDTPRFLFRERIVGELTRQASSRHPAVAVVAQAGQGKSTAVKQFLDRLDAASAWFQVGPEDADPAFFLSAIRMCLACALPGCPSDGGDDSKAAGEIALFDLPRRIDVLLGDLASCLKSELYLVFDDLHHLTGCEAGLFILNYLIENAPKKLRFILSSREPLPLGALAAKGAPAALCNADLALYEDEIADLFHQAFDVTLTRAEVARVFADTDGWVMGVSLLGLQAARDGGGTDAVRRGGLDMLDYFRRTVFATLEPRLSRPLLLTSLLEEIPVALATELTGEAAIGEDLEALALRNCFIRRLDPQATVYGLHHLFRQFLRERAEQELGGQAVREALRAAGRYFEREGNAARALHYLLAARDFAGMEEVLSKSGMAMLAANQTATLAKVLSGIPEAELDKLGFAPFYLALSHLDFAPALALPLLVKALAVFTARHDEIGEHGELLCLAHMISIHITATGHYREAEELLTRAEELYAGIEPDLDAYTTIMLARSLAIGRCIFLADADRATRYANQALTLARGEGLVNFEAAMLMVMGYIRIFAGQMSLARLWLEQASQIIARPEVGTFNRLAIRMMLFNFLFHDGDFFNYFDQKDQLVADIGNEMVSQSIAGPFCYVWEMDIALSRGRFEDALALAAKAKTHSPPLTPHLLSQILQLESVALALTGQKAEALEAAGQSARLREQAGGQYFITLNRIVTGLTFELCGDHETALARLREGVDMARAMPTAYLESCALMHLGYVRLRGGDTGAAKADIGAGLTLMRQNTYRHFWAWWPEEIAAQLSFAAANDLEPGYARYLAAERIDADLESDGAVVPRLTVRVLGGLAIVRQGRAVVSAESLTPAQRELMCLLLSSPGLKLVQETAQLHFWPDSPEPAAKAKFDTMVSRLRKVLAEALPEAVVAGLLSRDKGVIRLAHCRVDALDFLDAAERGLAHFRKQEFWQAGNAFALADSLYAGEFAPGVSGEDQIRDLRDRLSLTLSRAAKAWCEMLAEAGRLARAIDFAEKALRADPVDEDLWSLLYRLSGRQSAIKARRVAERFAALLRADEYPEAEIAEMVRNLDKPASPLTRR